MAMHGFKRRWVKVTAKGLLLAGGLWGCNPDGTSFRAQRLDPVPVIGDHTERRDPDAPRILEEQMTARHVDGRVLLSFPVEAVRAGGAHDSVSVRAQLVDGQAENVAAEATSGVSRNGGTVDLSLVPAQPLLGTGGNLGQLARYIVVVEATHGDQVTRIRRDLFRMLDFLEVNIVSPAAGSAAGTVRVAVEARTRAGNAQPDAQVSVRVKGAADADAVTFTGTTDASGHADIDVTLPSDGSASAELEVLVGEGGALGRWGGTVALEGSRNVLLTTDKPRYQPGQMMHLRALALTGATRTPYTGPVVFEVMDARGNLMFRKPATADVHGIASTSFRVGARVNEGQWKVRLGLGEDGRTGVVARNLMVEKYVLPRFKVDVVNAPAQVRPGENITLDVQARYTFGVALNGGTAHLQASLKGQLVADNVVTLNAEGRGSFTLSAPNTGDGRAAPLDVAVEVTDSAGGKSTGSRSVLVVPDGVALTGWFADPVSVGGRNTLYVLVTDAVGKPRPGSVRISVSGMADQVRVADASGLIELPVQSLQQGAWVSLQAMNDNSGGAYAYINAPMAGDGLRVKADRSVVDAGERVTFTVEASPARAGTAMIDVYAAGSRRASVPVTLDAQGRGTVELADIPGGLVRVLARTTTGGLVGQAALFAREDRNLRVDIASGAESYKPREEAAVRIDVKDKAGAGVPAAVGVTVVDEAVFALADVSGPVKAFGQGDALDVPAGINTETLVSSDATAREQAAMLAFGKNNGALHRVDLGLATRTRAVQEALAMVQKDADDIGRAASNAGVQPWVQDGNSLAQWLRDHEFIDPWGTPYAVADDGSTYYARLQSHGPDELPTTADDVSAYVYVGGQGGWGGEGDFAGGAPQAGGAEGGAANGGGGREDDPTNAAPPPSGAAVTVRKEFPETLLVDPLVITDAQGRADFSFPLADSITTWRVGAVASDLQGRVGVGQGGVRVFQDFFVDLDVPTTLTEGDEVAITAVINNFKAESQAVALSVEAGDWATILSGGNQVVNAGPVSVQGTTVRLKANRVGEFGLTLRAVGAGLSDAVVRRVRVRPSGDEKPFTRSDKLENRAQVTVDVPANATPGGTELLVKVQPGVTSEVVNGLDSMLRMPGGCFEQTSSSNYPNVLIAQYVARTGQSQPEVEEKVQRYMQEGYQRLTSYEVQGGGFSWFGDAPAHNVLTAYGLMQFVDMREVFPVDAALISRTSAWLAGQQKADGSFEPTEGGIAEGAIDAYQRNTFRTTAFLAWSLARAGGHAAVVDRALSWLRQNATGVTDPYSLAVYANALATVDATHADLPNASGALVALAHTGDEGTVSFPGAPPSDLAPCGNGPTEQTDLEVTALAAQAFIRGGTAPTEASGALRHLVRNKDSFGTWQSTQATIRSLQAMLASLGGSNETAQGTIVVRHNGNEVGRFTVTPADANVQRVVDLSDVALPGSHVVEIERTGTGNFQFQVAGRAFTPRSAPSAPAVTVNTTYSTTTPTVGQAVTVRSVIRTLSAFEQLMVVAPIPPGFDVDLESLETARAAGIINRAEVQGDVIHVYAPRLAPDAPVTLEWTVRPRLSANITAMPVQAYAYYDPSVRGEGTPVNLQVP